jgi:hypothetical protein
VVFVSVLSVIRIVLQALPKNIVKSHLWLLYLCICSRDRLLRTQYESLPKKINVFSRSLRSSGRKLFFPHNASLSKLLSHSPKALAIRWSHAILTSKFTLNCNTWFKFCLPQHSLSFLLYSRHRTRRKIIHSWYPLTTAGMLVQLVSVKLSDFRITLQVTSSYLFSFLSCRCLNSSHFYRLRGVGIRPRLLEKITYFHHL